MTKKISSILHPKTDYKSVIKQTIAMQVIVIEYMLKQKDS